MSEIEVRDNPDEKRFEIIVDGERAGFTAYQVHGQNYALTHTEIDPVRGGQGLGSILIRSTLGTLRERGIGVLPYCPFVKAFLQKHPDFADVVPEPRRAQFGLAAS